MIAFLLIVAIGFAVLCLIARGHGRRLSALQLGGLLVVSTINAALGFGFFWLVVALAWSLGAFAS